MYLAFLLGAVQADGTMHNRRDLNGAWTDIPSTADHWGRAIWALGVVAGSRVSPWSRFARAALRRAGRARSPFARSTAYSVLGAVELLHSHPEDDVARNLLDDAYVTLPRGSHGRWPWPEERLTYANAVLPEALIALGRYLEDETCLRNGLHLLTWLVDAQLLRGHLSFVPTGGRGPNDSAPGFDQQPIGDVEKQLKSALPDQPFLLALDNLEHIVDEVAPLVAGLLSDADNLPGLSRRGQDRPR